MVIDEPNCFKSSIPKAQPPKSTEPLSSVWTVSSSLLPQTPANPRSPSPDLAARLASSPDLAATSPIATFGVSRTSDARLEIEPHDSQFATKRNLAAHESRSLAAHDRQTSPLVTRRTSLAAARCRTLDDHQVTLQIGGGKKMGSLQSSTIMKKSEAAIHILSEQDMLRMKLMRRCQILNEAYKKELIRVGIDPKAIKDDIEKRYGCGMHTYLYIKGILEGKEVMDIESCERESKRLRIRLAAQITCEG
ncbi:uncharacterized protein A4U43_C04F20970 [Asparagus officinalis]|uniref:Uncharacterized protein n=1 Tax=Asparagus officinalis TaxID=4686 RepID=A0A5P1F2L3_ASPOF|nr:uncharacterized protein A4U43_C04F20970 [Asparagus officinalis]